MEDEIRYPLKVGEDSTEWHNLYARYSHIGCPGVQFEDNCTHPWLCACYGCCEMILDQRSKP